MRGGEGAEGGAAGQGLGQDAEHRVAAMHGGGGGCRLVSWAGPPRGGSGWWAGGRPTVGWGATRPFKEGRGLQRTQLSAPPGPHPGLPVPPSPVLPGVLPSGTWLGALLLGTWPGQPFPRAAGCSLCCIKPPKAGRGGLLPEGTQPQHLRTLGSGGGVFPPPRPWGSP